MAYTRRRGRKRANKQAALSWRAAQLRRDGLRTWLEHARVSQDERVEHYHAKVVQNSRLCCFVPEGCAYPDTFVQVSAHNRRVLARVARMARLWRHKTRMARWRRMREASIHPGGMSSVRDGVIRPCIDQVSQPCSVSEPHSCRLAIVFTIMTSPSPLP